MASLQERLVAALGDGPGVTAGDLLLCRESVDSEQAMLDRDVILEVRQADKFGDGPAILPASAALIREEGMFCVFHGGGCSVELPDGEEVEEDSTNWEHVSQMEDGNWGRE